MRRGLAQVQRQDELRPAAAAGANITMVYVSSRAPAGSTAKRIGTSGLGQIPPLTCLSIAPIVPALELCRTRVLAIDATPGLDKGMPR